MDKTRLSLFHFMLFYIIVLGLQIFVVPACARCISFILQHFLGAESQYLVAFFCTATCIALNMIFAKLFERYVWES